MDRLLQYGGTRQYGCPRTFHLVSVLVRHARDTGWPRDSEPMRGFWYRPPLPSISRIPYQCLLAHGMRRSRSARGARPPCTSMCAALFCCPFSGGALIPLLRQMVPSGEAARIEANKRRLTLDLASTFQRWLKAWRSRASACSGAVEPPSTGRPTEGEADTRFSAAPCAIANTHWERLLDNMPPAPG